MIRHFPKYFWRMTRCVFVGTRAYYLWMGTLFAVLGIAAVSYVHHLTDGLVVTNMTDQVSWGIGIANFVYFVGVAAAAALLVFPAYVLGRKDIKHVVLFGEVLAFVAVTMCMLFILTDLGRPERLWHIIPVIGLLNLPNSMLAWDVLVFNGYLALNLYIPCYLLYVMYLGRKPTPWVYLPPVFISILWAISIHTVTAFLLAGLGSRPHWSTAILAPRFLISAGASGPALLIIIFTIIRRFTRMPIEQSVFEYLKSILRVTMPVNLFLLGCELFQEFYTGSQHTVGAHYLFFGLHGHNVLTYWIWSAIALNITAMTVFLVPVFRKYAWLQLAASICTIIGIWIEKGMGLIFPGFVPSPLGEVAEYTPNLGEILVSFGVVAIGGLMFTVFAKIIIAIQLGELALVPAAPEGEPVDSAPEPAAA